MEINHIKALNEKVNEFSPEEVLVFFIDLYKEKIIFASSMGAEDQVLTNMLCSLQKTIRIFTLDTGRLFPETLSLIDYTKERYGIKIEVFFPESIAVENMVNTKGVNLFYESVENRRECCGIRKIQSLQRALSGMEAWITGLRREQSQNRAAVDIVEWDHENKLIKINPLALWSEKQVWEYISLHHVPYNKLHDKDFPSIGCQPCTRPVPKGADVRSGRWWWENPETKECGLHNHELPAEDNK